MAVVELLDSTMIVLDAETAEGSQHSIDLEPVAGGVLATVMLQKAGGRCDLLLLDPVTNMGVQHKLVSGFMFTGGTLPPVEQTVQTIIDGLNQFAEQELFKEVPAPEPEQAPAAPQAFGRTNQRVAESRDTAALVADINAQLKKLGVEVLFDALGKPKVVKTDRYVEPHRNGFKKYVPFL